MIISEKKYFWIWKRKMDLQVVLCALRMYAHTKDKKFKDYAEIFGKAAIEDKNKIKLYE